MPLMLGGSWRHQLAVEVHLRPVLAELGATMPAPGLCLLDSSFTTDGVVETYVERWGPAVRTACSPTAG